MTFMWLYSFAQNLFNLGCLMLLIGLVGTALTISLRLMKQIDPDDFDTSLYVCGPLLLAGIVIAHFPSLDTVQKNFEKYEELTKEMKDSKLLTHDQPIKEIESDEIPALLKHSCSSRVCR